MKALREVRNLLKHDKQEFKSSKHYKGNFINGRLEYRSLSFHSDFVYDTDIQDLWDMKLR